MLALRWLLSFNAGIFNIFVQEIIEYCEQFRKPTIEATLIKNMDAQRWFKHAKEQIKEKNYQKAEDLLKNTIQFDTEHEEAYHELALVSIHQGKYEQAKDYFEILLDLEPTVDHHIKYAGILLMLDEAAKAEQEFKDVLAEHPNNIDAKKGLADSYFRQNNFKDAIAKYDEILEEDPENAFIWYSKAETYYRAQNHEAAHDAIEKAIQLEAAPEFFAFKGDFFIRHDNFERALEQYRLAANISPHDEEIQMRLGFIYRVLDRPQDALDSFDNVIDINPYNREVLENKIEILESIGNTEAARGTTEQLVRLHPEDLKLGMNLAHYYMDNDGYQRASEIFEVLISEHQDNPEVWYGLAFSMVQIEEYQRAEEAIEMAILADKEEAEEYIKLKSEIKEKLSNTEN